MKPLVFVHGFMGGSAQWALQKPLGAARDLITLDLPGFGKNAHLPPINSIPGFAEWALGELTRLNIDHFDLLGHSMGGMIVQEMVRLAPSRVGKLILYGTGPTGVLPGRFETIETSMQRARADGPEATARRIAATWFLDGENHPECKACADLAAQSSLEAILAGLEAMQSWSGREHLASITSDTLVIWGDKDRTYAWPQIELLWQTIPKCNLAVIPAAAHAVHLEKPDLFNKLIA